jgi:hypothetical protein
LLWFLSWQLIARFYSKTPVYITYEVVAKNMEHVIKYYKEMSVDINFFTRKSEND